MYQDLTITYGSKEYNEAQQVGTELFWYELISRSEHLRNSCVLLPVLSPLIGVHFCTRGAGVKILTQGVTLVLLRRLVFQGMFLILLHIG